MCSELWSRFCCFALIKVEMVFSSHVTLGNYSLTTEFYWDKYSANRDLENGVCTQRFVLLLFSLHGSQCLRLLTLAASLFRLPTTTIGEGPHIYCWIHWESFLVTLSLLPREKGAKRSVGARSGQATVFHWCDFFLTLVLRVNSIWYRDMLHRSIKSQERVASDKRHVTVTAWHQERVASDKRSATA